MTEYIRSANLKAGDVLRFSKVDGEYHIGYKRRTVDDECQDDGVILVTTGKWKVVQI